MRRAAELYAIVGDDVRRQLNQAFMAIIEVDTDFEAAALTSPWREIAGAALPDLTRVKVRKRILWWS